MKQTRLANKALDAFTAIFGRLPNPLIDRDWLDGWARGYKLGRRDQKRAQGKPENGGGK